MGIIQDGMMPGHFKGWESNLKWQKFQMNFIAKSWTGETGKSTRKNQPHLGMHHDLSGKNVWFKVGWTRQTWFLGISLTSWCINIRNNVINSMDNGKNNPNVTIWLVVWNIYCVSICWEFHHPNWRTHNFSEGLKPRTSHKSVATGMPQSAKGWT